MRRLTIMALPALLNACATAPAPGELTSGRPAPRRPAPPVAECPEAARFDGRRPAPAVCVPAAEFMRLRASASISWRSAGPWRPGDALVMRDAGSPATLVWEVVQVRGTPPGRVWLDLVRLQ